MGDERACGMPVGEGTGPEDPGGGPLTEAELTALALSADPGAPLDDEAVPMAHYLAQTVGLLPEWYMPAPMLRTRGWKVPVVLGIVVAFVVIEALGLCSAFGQVVPG